MKRGADQDHQHGRAEETTAPIHQLQQDAPHGENGADCQHVCSVFK